MPDTNPTSPAVTEKAPSAGIAPPAPAAEKAIPKPTAADQKSPEPVDPRIGKYLAAHPAPKPPDPAVTQSQAILDQFKKSLGDDASILSAFAVKPLGNTIELTSAGLHPIGIRLNGSVPVFYCRGKTANDFAHALTMAEIPPGQK